MLMTPLCLLLHVSYPGVRVPLAESLIHDLNRVSEWNGLWGTRNTMHPQLPPLTIGRTGLKEPDDLDILGMTFHSKMTFEKHLY